MIASANAKWRLQSAKVKSGKGRFTFFNLQFAFCIELLHLADAYPSWMQFQSHVYIFKKDIKKLGHQAPITLLDTCLYVLIIICIWGEKILTDKV